MCVDPRREPWNAFGPSLRQRFGGRVQRIGLDGGFSCPNRDGTRGTGGCSFCDAGGSRAAYQNPDRSLPDQMRFGMQWAQRRFGARRFIAYFQAFTNTHAPTERLRTLWDSVLLDERVVGLAVGTRPDCLDDETIGLLAEHGKHRLTWVELGYLSENPAVLARCNRQEDAGEFARAATRLREAGIPVCAHVIFGLPGEPLEATVRAAELMNRLGVWGVKLHNLHIVSDAPLAAAWRRGEVPLPDRASYLQAVCDFLERLDPACLIHRLVGDAPRHRLLAPEWMGEKETFLRDLRAEFARRGTRQGHRATPPATDRTTAIGCGAPPPK